MRHPSILLAAALTLAGCATGTPRMQEAEVEKLMHRYDGHVPGASLLVIRDGETLVQKSYGFADLESGRRAEPVTNYRLASVTKQFTAAAVLLLAEDGRLDIDDKLRRWLPSLPAIADRITLRQLLIHRSGLIDYEDVMAEDTSVPLRDADVLRLLESQQATYFEPGSEYRYSNSGYSLLALVVERASGESFQSFLRRRIFLPLGMEHTLAFVEGGPAIADRAYGYSLVGENWTRTDQSMTSAVLGDGGIYSSIADLAKWDAALYDDRLLSDASRRLAFTAWTRTDDVWVDYGFGWRITDDRLWHSGETIGFRNVIVRYPHQRLLVVLLSNRNDPEPYATALAVAQVFLEP